jgi:hypothetical protein
MISIILKAGTSLQEILCFMFVRSDVSLKHYSYYPRSPAYLLEERFWKEIYVRYISYCDVFVVFNPFTSRFLLLITSEHQMWRARRSDCYFVLWRLY